VLKLRTTGSRKLREAAGMVGRMSKAQPSGHWPSHVPRCEFRHTRRLPSIIKYNVNVHNRIQSTASCIFAIPPRRMGGVQQPRTDDWRGRGLRSRLGRRNIIRAAMGLLPDRLATWRDRAKRIANRIGRGYAQHHNLAVRQAPQ
jgi:hypothetical protein